MLRSVLRARSLRYWSLRYNHTQPLPPYYPKQISQTCITASPQPTNDLVPSDGYFQPHPNPNDHIVVAMSSGVDSSVCAALYSKYSHVHGIYMANWSQSSQCTERDWKDVQTVCSALGIPCERLNFEREYWNDVFQPMLEKYSSGLTPNPDVGCNKFVKFGKLVDVLEQRYKGKKWWLVTGHYARVMKKRDDEYHLLRGLSTRKDQSYYLSSIPSSVLPRLILPMGHMLKEDTRGLAKQYHLHVSTKPDSQGLCFVDPQHGNFRDFLSEYIECTPGEVVTEDGKVWGFHKGLWHATIGQKSSISMPQGDPQYKGVWFVAEKNIEKNQLVIVRGHDHPKLYKSKVEVVDCEWVYDWEKVKEINLEELQFQYHSLTKATPIKKLSVIQENGQKLKIELMKPVRAMAPGQQGVLYRGHQVLGGGMISKTEE
ncbi:hypothetical protein KGF56_003969 [Candida oxycetoniae]|uniref:tRNA-5-taurinomethyluridine 2-sulfurtransferase n=1 Tax=Candida oxycetoniae TaxID=497107 RepID=A0AAI9WWS1_9ASCO|nr:uncharacterized protein KGF56_003969 [Candida oxycetoniae]KAI3403234.2 hypothetical protein KGF56_003969 [Candida oxycetoniae]